MPYLIALTGPHTDEVFEIKDGRTTVGRGPACDVRLGQDAAVSRAHALFVTAGGVVQVQDAGSTHGVYVNGRRVDQSLLRTGDCVQFGASAFMVQPVPRQVSERPRLRMVVPRGAGGAGLSPGGEKVISPGWGFLLLAITIVAPIPFGLQIAWSYFRRSHPANQRFGAVCFFVSLLSTVVQIAITIPIIRALMPFLRALQGQYSGGFEE